MWITSFFPYTFSPETDLWQDWQVQIMWLSSLPWGGARCPVVQWGQSTLFPCRPKSKGSSQRTQLNKVFTLIFWRESIRLYTKPKKKKLLYLVKSKITTEKIQYFLNCSPCIKCLWKENLDANQFLQVFNIFMFMKVIRSSSPESSLVCEKVLQTVFGQRTNSQSLFFQE